MKAPRRGPRNWNRYEFWLFVGGAIVLVAAFLTTGAFVIGLLL